MEELSGNKARRMVGRLWRRRRDRRSSRREPLGMEAVEAARQAAGFPSLSAKPRSVIGSLRGPRALALWVIAGLVAAASVTAFAESYRGLFEWSDHHGLTGVWAYAWPLQVDVFVAVGELALFVALTDRWSRRSRGLAWTVSAVGLAVSVAGNVGHIASHALTSRATAAVPPLAAAAALAVGFSVLKRVVEAHHATQEQGQAGEAEPEREPEPGELAAMSKAEAIRLALAHTGGNVIAAQGWLAERGIKVDRAYAHDVKAGRSGRRRHVQKPLEPERKAIETAEEDTGEEAAA